VSVADLEKAWRGAPSGSPAPVADLRPQAQPVHVPAVRITPPKVCILHAKGSNRDREAALACQLADGAPEVVYVSQVLAGEKRLSDYQMLVIPGGFSYGDDLGAGVLWAMTLKHRLGDDLARFVADGRPVLGICNGFQVLVKAGLLPGPEFHTNQGHPVTLTANESGRFECRWVYLKANSCSPSLFTEDLDELIYCPVAHGEGRLIAQDDELLKTVQRENLAALTYVDAAGNPVGYPGNPNGSALNIAGLTNPAGNVLGLMPHPEDHVFAWQRPDRHRGVSGMMGLRLFENGVRHA
jgi:phosphoribosylformylglycinamidine synthase